MLRDKSISVVEASLNLFKESECRVAKGNLFHSLITDGRKES